MPIVLTGMELEGLPLSQQENAEIMLAENSAQPAPNFRRILSLSEPLPQGRATRGASYK